MTDNADALSESRKESDNLPPKSTDNTTNSCGGSAKTWIEIQLVGEDGKPIANQKYEIELPDGTKKEGSLDKDGKARVEEIDKGECQVAFVDIDREAWEPVS
jgi:hypothetical protein